MAAAASSAGAGGLEGIPTESVTLPPRQVSAPDADNVCTVVEFRHGANGMIEKHTMKIKTVQRETRAPKAAVARMARMRRFGAAATEGSTANVTYFDYNLVKLKRPGDEDDTEKELDELVEKLKAKAAGSRGTSSSGALATNTSMETEENTASLKVSNLAEDVYETDLRALFEPFGRLRRVTVMTDSRTGESRGFAFVNFNTRSEAERAKAALHRTGLNNTIIEIDWSKANPRSTESTFRSGYGGALPQG
ncbi:hypothetical protein FNF31_06637 [Cafeteria roenbergensis]|uniref:RRM domain-containing protein n=1 Tax=Cafeteria roenbergensis TaxID=33653 RepID=A0A5A8CI35_CAFRO|nr:hypothetical protein FNF31_06637 [Cafeteria roenbergensis]